VKLDVSAISPLPPTPAATEPPVLLPQFTSTKGDRHPTSDAALRTPLIPRPPRALFEFPPFVRAKLVTYSSEHGGIIHHFYRRRPDPQGSACMFLQWLLPFPALGASGATGCLRFFSPLQTGGYHCRFQLKSIHVIPFPNEAAGCHPYFLGPPSFRAPFFFFADGFFPSQAHRPMPRMPTGRPAFLATMPGSGSGLPHNPFELHSTSSMIPPSASRGAPFVFSSFFFFFFHPFSLHGPDGIRCPSGVHSLSLGRHLFGMTQVARTLFGFLWLFFLRPTKLPPSRSGCALQLWDCSTSAGFFFFW